MTRIDKKLLKPAIINGILLIFSIITLVIAKIKMNELDKTSTDYTIANVIFVVSIIVLVVTSLRLLRFIIRINR